jgi:hypothetical protein
MEAHDPKVVAPTPEQITTVKVHAFSRNIMEIVPILFLPCTVFSLCSHYMF